MKRPAPDPICAVIDRHRHAFAAAAKDDTGVTAWPQADDAAETLLETTPSTIRASSCCWTTSLRWSGITAQTFGLIRSMVATHSTAACWRTSLPR
jgi:hypothetical protein